MILPIYAYGQAVLKKIAAPITPEYPDLKTLLDNLWETMYHADGVGIAAPQVGLSIRIFVIDTLEVKRGKDADETDQPIKQVFINAEMLEETGSPWNYEEGCLSIPYVRGDVERLDSIRIRYQDENFEQHERVFTGVNARVIQHEYDHLQGVLFTEKLKPLKKRLVQRKLEDIRVGKIKTDYRMKFAVIR
ncbi:MAG: peptide deformylase [Chitinophagales bacterium]|nr:peptide deformylase [Chitinophagales bacterium]